MINVQTRKNKPKKKENNNNQNNIRLTNSKKNKLSFRHQILSSSVINRKILLNYVLGQQQHTTNELKYSSLINITPIRITDRTDLIQSECKVYLNENDHCKRYNSFKEHAECSPAHPRMVPIKSFLGFSPFGGVPKIVTIRTKLTFC